MSSGLEPELSVVVDVLFPIAAITAAANEFQERFPGTPLRLFVEALGAGYQRVLDRSWGCADVTERQVFAHKRNFSRGSR